MDDPRSQAETTHDSNTACTYRFIPSSLSDTLSEDKRLYDLVARQQPEQAKISVTHERDRRFVEPPPILQMRWLNCTPDETKKCLQSPFYFMVAHLVAADAPDEILTPAHDYLAGTTVSSLYRLRDVDNTDGGFFVFGDLAVKRQGHYRFRFSLFEIVDGAVQNRKTIVSNEFTVFLSKQFPGPLEATFLSRTFSDQGVKMRIRKEHRLHSQPSAKRKKALSMDDQLPRKSLPRGNERRRPSQSGDVSATKWHAFSQPLTLTRKSHVEHEPHLQLVESPKTQSLACPQPPQTTPPNAQQRLQLQQSHFRYQSMPPQTALPPSPTFHYSAITVPAKTSEIPPSDDTLPWRPSHVNVYILPPPTAQPLSRSLDSVPPSPTLSHSHPSSSSSPQSSDPQRASTSPLSDPLLARYHLSNESPLLPFAHPPSALPTPVTLPPLLSSARHPSPSQLALDMRLPPIRSIMRNDKCQKRAGHLMPTLETIRVLPPHH